MILASVIPTLMFLLASTETPAATCPVFDPRLEQPDYFKAQITRLLPRAKAGERAARVALANAYYQIAETEPGERLVDDLLSETPDDEALQRLRNKLARQRIDAAGLFGRIGAAKKLRTACEADYARTPSGAAAQRCLAQYYGQAPGIAGGSTEKRDAVLAAMTNPVEERLTRANAFPDMPASERLRLLQQAHKLAPDAPRVNEALLAFHLEQEGYASARPYIDRLSQLGTEHELGRLGLYHGGHLYRETGADWQASHTAIRRFLSGPTHIGGNDYRAKAHQVRAELLQARGCLASARTAYQRALEVDRKLKSARKGLRAVERQILAQQTAE